MMKDTFYNFYHELILLTPPRFCSLGPDMQKKIRKCDFSYFIAIAAPYAPAAKFRIMCDWGNWVRKQPLKKENN